MPRGRERKPAEGGSRAFWSGTISFGLVSVPVDLYAANRPPRVSLRMLAPDGTPLRREYVCSEDETPISGDELVRGYELDGDYVIVSDEELEALEPEKSRDIDLRQFVDIAEIPPLFFERGYFMAPAGESEKAYRLLAETMEQSGKAGIATFVMRGKSHLIAILAEQGILHAETLRYSDELRSIEDILPEPAAPKAAQVKKIRARIKKHSREGLDLDELHDDFAVRIRALAEEKLERGEDLVEVSEVPAPEAEGAAVVDIMKVLKQRLGEAKAAKTKRSPPGKGKAKKKAG